MASDVISMPLQQLPLLGRLVYEIEATLDIRNDSGAFVPVPFLFDTGTHFTTIPIALANQLDVPFDTNNPVGISGTTGASSGYMKLRQNH